MEQKTFHLPVLKSLILTGSSGFIGSRFLDLNAEKYHIRTIPWQQLTDPDLDLSGAEVVVHMAALNHRMDKVPEAEYMNANFKLTRLLGERAKADGVGRFVFLSTVKVFGEANINGQPFTETDPCHPADAYGSSKLEAERALKALESPDFTVSIIRAPLVYGPGVKGNMERLIKLAKTTLPLGFKGIDNKRTMVFVDNLIALIDAVIYQRSSGLFLAADDLPISSHDAIIMLREAMGKSGNTFKVPGFFIGLLGILAPKLKMRLFDSLVFNNDHTKKQLNFRNPYTVEQGFAAMINPY